MKCKDCAHWMKMTEGQTLVGYAVCAQLNHLKLSEPLTEAAGVYDTGENPDHLITGKDYGCIYFTQK